MTVIPERHTDWRDSLALASDLALLGIATALACVPVVTAGAALATASVAADHVCTHRTLPPLSLLGRTFRRAFLPGVGATAATALAAALLAVDLRALANGRVPGGPVLLGLTAVVAAAGLAVALLALVRVGATGGQGWRAAVAWAVQARPATALVVQLVVALLVAALPAVLALAIPVLALLLPGFALFALHVAVRRSTPGSVTR